MSKQAFEDFVKKVDTSAGIKKEAEEAYQQLGNAVSQAHMNYFDAMVELGKQSGFEFKTAEVMKKFEADLEELDDAQLEGVAGGVTFIVSKAIPQLSTDEPLPPSTSTFIPNLPPLASDLDSPGGLPLGT